MQELNLFEIFTEKLNFLAVPYIVTGSVASIIYGEPRITHDVDIVITMPLNIIDKFQKLFPIEEFYCPPFEILKIEILKENRGHCNIIHHQSGFKADIYFAGSSSFQKWALENAKVINFHNSKFSIAPVEYVIINKLIFYKEGQASKHINDINAILLNSNEIIDFKLLKNYIIQFGLNKEWELCSA